MTTSTRTEGPSAEEPLASSIRDVSDDPAFHQDHGWIEPGDCSFVAGRGGHREGPGGPRLREHTEGLSEAARALRAVAAPALQTGDMTIHHGHMIHGSPHNNTQTPREAAHHRVVYS